MKSPPDTASNESGSAAHPPACGLLENRLPDGVAALRAKAPNNMKSQLVRHAASRRRKPFSSRGTHSVVGNGAEFPDSFFACEMKDYRKMSRAELLACLERLKASHAARRRADRQRAASALRESAERLRAILDTAVEGIITIDEHGLIESVNRAAEKIFGYSAAELIGQNVSLLMPSPHRERHDEYLQNYLRTGQAKIIGIGREVTGRRKNGSVFPMDLSVSEVRLADRRLFTGFIRDITERKRLEREILEISERERRRIGHDLHDGLCQHLTAIELKSQVLAQKLARRSREAAERAAEIARDVRDAISQTRQLARGLSPVTLESEGLMAALQELAVNTTTLFRVHCRFACHSPVPVRDSAAATHLLRIAQEAVSNALKHGQARHIDLALERTRDKIVLRVSDDGRGLPQDFAAQRQKGMGLRIMQSRAGMMAGTLALERNPTGGVSVTVSVPAPDDRPKENQA